MSLSILLDYRPEDTKKNSFEVSLFAELFNEMLMRDFGFNIYKALFAMPDTEQSNTERDTKDKRDDTANSKSDNDEPKEKRTRKDAIDASDSSKNHHKKDESSTSKLDSDSKSAKESKDKDNKDKEREKDKNGRERRISRRDDDSDDDAFSMRSSDGKKREHKKLITVDSDLLLSFVYFDQTHCGYIFSNHLEDLFHALGLHLSRADTKKIISKVAPRSLFYRFVSKLRLLELSE